MGIKAKRKPSKQHGGVREAPARYATHAESPHNLADALFTTTQQRVLGALYGQPQRSFTVSELIASTGAGSGAVQRELAKLTASGLLTMQPVGNQKRYQANPAAPIHGELVAIVQKTVGLAEPLRAALKPLENKITVAFVFGSVAKRSDTARSDIDLMVVGDVTFSEVLETVYPLHARLGREVNPIVMKAREFRARAKDPGFIARVLNGPRIMLFGDVDDA
ncbi:MAG: [Protein-PII] uridylyltransferase [Rhodanobacteraceae bacterium]|jgi:predicted nucleotidyltransferase|nr:MAG: [Protein-PII] uridylyltransferase [Rhodanobacteraceae bacterium]